MKELIIVGAGPAGITSAVYAARKMMDFLVITKDIGGQAALSGDIENYTGYQFITGPQLADKFNEHMQKFGVELRVAEEVVEVKRDLGNIYVKTKEAQYKTRSVIIASGKRPKELGIPGEKEFKNRGLTYCATCDGPLFKGKDVAIIGGGNSALDAGLQMAKIAKVVYIVNIAPHLTGDHIMIEKLRSYQNVEVLNNTKVKAIYGDKTVSGIQIEQDGKAKELQVQGVFVEIGLIPNSEFVIGVSKNEIGEIKVNCRNETNIPGIFAAGDVTDVPEKQIIVACGEGAKATLSVFKYLTQHR